MSLSVISTNTAAWSKMLCTLRMFFESVGNLLGILRISAENLDSRLQKFSCGPKLVGGNEFSSFARMNVLRVICRLDSRPIMSPACSTWKTSMAKQLFFRTIGSIYWIDFETEIKFDFKVQSLASSISLAISDKRMPKMNFDWSIMIYEITRFHGSCVWSCYTV